MSGQLPLFLRARLDGLIQAGCVTHADLAMGAAEVSRKYRGDRSKTQVQIASRAEALGYIATRLPATYAAVAAVMEQIKVLLLDFNPSSLLDIGAGPGTATLAAQNAFDIDMLTLVEPNMYLRDAGMQLVEGADWITKPLQDYTAQPADMIIASYVFNEMNPDQVVAAVRNYWDKCNGVMVIIEPGTPQGAGIIWALRKVLADYIIGPCPQGGACPLEGTDRWCHFSTRVERSKLHKQLKDADMGYEDEKFSWVAFSRLPVERPAHRLIGHPSGTKVRELQVCNVQGVAETMVVPKSHPLYKVKRKLEWGDGF